MAPVRTREGAFQSHPLFFSLFYYEDIFPPLTKTILIEVLCFSGVDLSQTDYIIKGTYIDIILDLSRLQLNNLKNKSDHTYGLHISLRKILHSYWTEIYLKSTFEDMTVCVGRLLCCHFDFRIVYQVSFMEDPQTRGLLERMLVGEGGDSSNILAFQGHVGMRDKQRESNILDSVFCAGNGK